MPGGFDPTVWSIIPGVSYPYLTASFTGTPQVISGNAYSDHGATAAAGATVTELVNGSGGLTALAGYDGYYYLLLPANTISSSGSQVLTYTTGAGAGAAYQQNATGSVSGLNIYGTYLAETTPVSAYSGIASGLAAAIGGNSAAQAVVTGADNLQINPSAASFAIDQPITTGTLVLFASGAVTQTGAIRASALQLLGAGAYTLTDTSNSIGTLAADTGSLSLTDSAALTLNTVNEISDLTAAGAVTLTTNSLTLTASTGLISAAGQTITLTPFTNSAALGVGTATSGLSLTQAMLNDITAATVVFGSTNSTGGITVGSSIAVPTTVTSLSLISGGPLAVNATLTNANANGTLALQGSTLTLGAAVSANGTSGTASLSTTGTVTPTAPITAANLVLLGSGASYTLTNASNSFSTLAANTGSVTLTDSSSLAIGTVGGTSGVTTTGTLTLNVTGTITDPSAPVSVGAFILNGGNWTQNVATLPTFSAASDFELNNGSTVLRVRGGNGTSASPYLLTDVYGLQGVKGFLNSNFDLANNINGSGTATWNGGAGFVPIGGMPQYSNVPSTNGYNGVFNGNGFTISSLTIYLPGSSSYVGLFRYLGGTVENVALTNVNITGGFGTGGLVGGNDNTSALTNNSVTGTVTSTSNAVGGLIGYNYGPISNSWSSANVTGGLYVGGLSGFNLGAVTNSYASGNVTGGGQVGGLLGYNNATVSNVYAIGNVAETAADDQGDVGGLIGDNSGHVTVAYATGTVTGDLTVADQQTFIGGLIGNNGGAISQVFATGNVTGLYSVGGLVGGESGGSIANAYATGNVFAAGSTAGGLVGESENGGTINAVYAANSQVSSTYNIQVGALVGAINLYTGSGATITSGYWDSTKLGSIGIGYDGTSTSQDIHPLSTGALQAQLPTGFSTAYWGIIPNQTYPFLLTQPGVISGEVFTTYGGSSAGSGISVFDVINGVAGATPATTDVNGDYYFFLGFNGIPTGTQVLAYTSGGVSYAQNAFGAVTGLNIYGAYLSETTPVATASSLASGLTAAMGSNTALQTQVRGLTNTLLNPTGATFAFDQPITTGTLVISSTGAVTQSAPITANNLALLGSGGSYALTNSDNTVGTLAANTGSVDFTDSCRAQRQQRGRLQQYNRHRLGDAGRGYAHARSGQRPDQRRWANGDDRAVRRNDDDRPRVGKRHADAQRIRARRDHRVDSGIRHDEFDRRDDSRRHCDAAFDRYQSYAAFRRLGHDRQRLRPDRRQCQRHAEPARFGNRFERRRRRQCHERHCRAEHHGNGKSDYGRGFGG